MLTFYVKSETKLIITDLKKRRGELEISIPHLELKEGAIHGLFGGNGCGKSSLSKLLIGDLVPDAGRIDFGHIQAHEITLMPQRPYMMQRSVYENIIYPLQIRNKPINEEKIDGYLEKTQLLHKKNQYARTLSSGEQQKISFIRALVFQPKFVMMDETLSNLDIDSLAVFLEWILAWQKEYKATWLIVSHQFNQLQKLCDVFHYMKKGHIIASGTLDTVLEYVDSIER